MDSPDDLIDPQNEVRKLQDLVKKLERQNELLRTKQDSILDKPKRPTNQNNNDNIGVNINNDINSTHNDIVQFDYNEQKSIDEFDLDDLEDVDCSLLAPENDSW